MKPYRFHQDARTEYRDALAWYANRSLDAADGFADAITHGIREVRERPQTWPRWRARLDVRVRVIRRYPYLIAYVDRRPQIVILAVAHQRREAGYWLSRL